MKKGPRVVDARSKSATRLDTTSQNVQSITLATRCKVLYVEFWTSDLNVHPYAFCRRILQNASSFPRLAYSYCKNERRNVFIFVTYSAPALP